MCTWRRGAEVHKSSQCSPKWAEEEVEEGEEKEEEMPHCLLHFTLIQSGLWSRERETEKTCVWSETEDVFRWLKSFQAENPQSRSRRRSGNVKSSSLSP